MKCGSKRMAKGGKAIMTIKDTPVGQKMAGAARRTAAQEKAMPMKAGGKVKAYAEGGVVVRGKGAATKGFKARGPMC